MRAIQGTGLSRCTVVLDSYIVLVGKPGRVMGSAEALETESGVHTAANTQIDLMTGQMPEQDPPAFETILSRNLAGFKLAILLQTPKCWDYRCHYAQH